MGLRGGILRRAMRVGRPESEVGEDLFNDLGLVKECDDPHGSPTLWADQRIGLMNGREVGVLIRWSSAITGHRIQQPRPLQKLLQNLRPPLPSPFTPFLDRHNDAIEIFVEKKDGSLRLTDDGYTIRDLRASGMEFTTDKRKGHLAAVLNGFGVRLESGEICVVGSLEDFPQKKHNLVQAILAVNDMFVMAEEHVLSLFKEDVALFLEANRIPAFLDFKLSGKSGFDHKFDFGLPKTAEKPQRVLQAINNLTKESATSLAFALGDVRAIRTDPIGGLAMINDAVRPPNEEYLAALRAYEILPLLWSHRQEVISTLNGRG